MRMQGIWSLYLAQKVMNLCWEHDPNKRPKMSQVVEWCNLTEFGSLRAVYHLKKGKMTALCQCLIDRNHVHSLDTDMIDVSRVQYTITPCTEDDALFSCPVLSPSNKKDNDQNKSAVEERHYFQIWLAQKTDSDSNQLQIFSYNTSQVGYRVSISLCIAKLHVHAVYSIRNIQLPSWHLKYQLWSMWARTCGYVPWIINCT